MEDQPRTRHQLQRTADNRAIEPRRRHLAVGRKALLVLRPKSMHHASKGPPGTLRIGCPVGRALLRGLAIGRRPGQRQDIEIEPAGFALPAVLRKRDNGEKEEKANGDRDRFRRPTYTMTKHGVPLTLTSRNRNKP